MGLLANVLPGLRDLRAPLAAGYTWLFAIWIAASPHIDAHPTAGVSGAVARLVSGGNDVGRAAIVTFAAFIVGSISEAGTTRLFRLSMIDPSVHRGNWFASSLMAVMGHGRSAFLTSPALQSVVRWEDQKIGDLQTRHGLTKYGCAASLRTALAPFLDFASDCWLGVTAEGKVALGTETFDEQHPTPGLIESRAFLRAGLAAEWDRMALRLLLDEEKRIVFSEYDRYRAEASFRWAIAVPLIGLGFALSVEGPLPWRLVALPASVVLAVVLVQLGRSAQRSANTYIVDALALDMVEPPSLRPLDAADPILGRYSRQFGTAAAKRRAPRVRDALIQFRDEVVRAGVAESPAGNPLVESDAVVELADALDAFEEALELGERGVDELVDARLAASRLSEDQGPEAIDAIGRSIAAFDGLVNLSTSRDYSPFFKTWTYPQETAQ